MPQRNSEGIWRAPGLSSWVISSGAGVAAFAVCSQGLFYLGGRWQLPLFVGFAVGLASVVPWQGALVSAVCVVGGSMLLAPVLSFPAAMGVPEYVLAAVLSLAAGATPAALRLLVAGATRKRLTFAMSAALVAWVLLNLWLPLTFDGLPPRSYGLLPASKLTPQPVPGQFLGDEALYRRIFYLMHEGQPYYSAFHTAWLDAPQRASAPPNTAVAIRLPTYFWLWKALPADAFTIVYVYLVLVSLGVVATACIAGQLVGPRLAPLAAATLATYALVIGYNVTIVYVELPAMCVALVGVALFLAAAKNRRMPLLWAAVAVIVAAALTREILAYLLALGAASALLEPKGERLTRAAPWLAGLTLFGGAYSLHIAAVSTYVQAGSGAVSYSNGGAAFVADAFARFSDGFGGTAVATVCFAILGALGALASRRRAGVPFAAFALAAITLPFVVMLFVGNSPPPDAAGRLQNYWGTLVLPLAFALWPASALLLAKRPDATSGKSGEAS